MSKPEQVLIIEPQHELRFKGPFSLPVTSYMKLTNPSDRKVVFKIKTTAPKKYCVRPNSGILEPNASSEIAVCLQPFIFEPSERNRHKFMVQTLFAPEGEFNLEQLWKDTSAEQLMDSKLKCVFELAAESVPEVAAEADKGSPNPKVPSNASVSGGGGAGSAASAAVSFSSTEAELSKAAVEMQQLREEEMHLRQENFKLKEDILRLQKMAPLSAGSNQFSMSSKYTPMANAPGLSMVYVGICVLVAVVGIFMGKFVL